jgi:hypothetical protein
MPDAMCEVEVDENEWYEYEEVGVRNFGKFVTGGSWYKRTLSTKKLRCDQRFERREGKGEG